VQAFDPAGVYTAAAVQQALQGRTGPRRLTFDFQRLNATNGYMGPLHNVEAGTVTLDGPAEVHRSASFTIVEGDTINYLTDRIKPYVRLTMPDGGQVSWPQGVFLLSSPDRELAPIGGVTRTVAAYDQTVILQGDLIGDRYSVAAGTRYTDAITAAVAGYGFAANVTTSTKTLPVAIDWAGGTSKLTIVNDLLAAINYAAAWFDEDGTFQAVPYVLPDTVVPGYVYATDSTSVIVGNIGHSLDLFNVPNKWVLVVSEPDRAVLTSTYTNTVASSPTSTVSRGRTITKYDTGQTAPDQGTLDGLAARMAFEDSQVYEAVTFTTALMPFHSDLDVLGVSVDGLALGSVKFQEVGWSMDLRVGGTMTHSVRRTVSA
jgi:hypothetical protein